MNNETEITEVLEDTETTVETTETTVEVEESNIIETTEVITEPFFPLGTDPVIITQSDVLIYFTMMMVLVLFAFIINRVITFIPKFMQSFRAAAKHPLDTSLDKSDMGTKNLFDRWFPW